MTEPLWYSALTRYRVPHQLATRVRHSPFRVSSSASALVVTPTSGHPRRIREGEWERALPLLDGSGRARLTQATFNSSYVAAIVEDLRRN